MLNEPAIVAIRRSDLPERRKIAAGEKYESPGWHKASCVSGRCIEMAVA